MLPFKRANVIHQLYLKSNMLLGYKVYSIQHFLYHLYSFVLFLTTIIFVTLTWKTYKFYTEREMQQLVAFRLQLLTRRDNLVEYIWFNPKVYEIDETENAFDSI